MPVDPLIVPAYAAANTLLFLGTEASPSVFTSNLDRIGDIKLNGVSLDMVDVSNQESTAHRVLGTLKKLGDLTFNYYWEPDQAQDQELFAVYEAGQLRSWQLQWPNGTLWLFNAYLSKFAPDASIAKALMAPSTLSVDGDVVVIYP